ncbi:hypothetical protein BESB_005340 [Besnoitia besnoiti]|uniref:Uncharacterized protein n=1 Tax=Besnoitia besnoiti TaxID=94643 RepID=A0A2A9MPY7_BESBE|nr:hypothetical protein BESB_005340 [Besnoitia besnoiti]PFH38193.1 hypothetical protein BESB_005340 [Besnoitia besnoiti]
MRKHLGRTLQTAPQEVGREACRARNGNENVQSGDESCPDLTVETQQTERNDSVESKNAPEAKPSSEVASRPGVEEQSHLHTVLSAGGATVDIHPPSVSIDHVETHERSANQHIDTEPQGPENVLETAETNSTTVPADDLAQAVGGESSANDIPETSANVLSLENSHMEVDVFESAEELSSLSPKSAEREPISPSGDENSDAVDGSLESPRTGSEGVGNSVGEDSSPSPSESSLAAESGETLPPAASAELSQIGKNHEGTVNIDEEYDPPVLPEHPSDSGDDKRPEATAGAGDSDKVDVDSGAEEMAPPGVANKGQDNDMEETLISSTSHENTTDNGTHEKPTASIEAHEESQTTTRVQASAQHFFWGGDDELSQELYLSPIATVEVSGIMFAGGSAFVSNEQGVMDSPAMASFSTFESLSPSHSPFHGAGMMSPTVMMDDSGSHLPPSIQPSVPFLPSPQQLMPSGGMGSPAMFALSSNTNFGTVYSPTFSAGANSPAHMPRPAEFTPSTYMLDSALASNVPLSPGFQAAPPRGSFLGMRMPLTGLSPRTVFQDGTHDSISSGSGQSIVSLPPVAQELSGIGIEGSAEMSSEVHSGFFPSVDPTTRSGYRMSALGSSRPLSSVDILLPHKPLSSSFSTVSIGSQTETYNSDSGINPGTTPDINSPFRATEAWNAWSPSRVRDPFND